MIEFTCRCGHRFSAADSEAGDDLQCPTCGLLLTVPTHSEVPALVEDGTYAVDDARPVENKQRVEELGYVFKPGTLDASGHEIDLRRTLEDLDHVGASDDLRTAEADPVGLRPRYDPETGELIAPIGVKPHPADQRIHPSDIPMAKPALTYATSSAQSSTTVASAMTGLFRPVNLLVMGIVLFLQLILQILIFITAYLGFFFVAPMLMFIQLGMFCHYGNVIDEIGPGEADELPRPMRDLRFHEDFWTPLSTLIGSAVICYMPAIMCEIAATNDLPTFLNWAIGLGILAGLIAGWRIAWMLATTDWAGVSWLHEVLIPIVATVTALSAVIGPALALAITRTPPILIHGVALLLAGFGTILVPAVMLTIATSGSTANLRPDRLQSVIRIAGARYFIPVVAWAVGAPAYLAAMLLTSGVSIGFGSVTLRGGWGGIAVLGLDALILAVAVYAMHLLAWELGRIYRARQAEFPWIYQRHISARQHRSASAIQRKIQTRRAENALRPVARRSPGPR